MQVALPFAKIEPLGYTLSIHLPGCHFSSLHQEEISRNSHLETFSYSHLAV